jgi:signal transduction histidine kinase
MSAATASVVALLVLTLIQSVHEDNQLIFEPIAMGMNFYMVGRSTRSAGYLWRQVGVLALGIGSSAIGAWHTGGQSVADVVSGSLIFIGLPYAAGLVIRRRKTMSASLTLATGNLEREEERRAALAVIEERNRIARELHDAIAHEVSVMVIQTSVARRRLLRNRQQSEEALRSVIESGHRALEELRQITGVVRRVDAYSGPAPGLSRLADLIAAMQSTGLRVDLSICGSSVALPPGLDLVAYRIIQEALMNTVKHAGPVESFVTLTFLADVLELEVVDSGGNSAATHLGGSGLGLVGMQERVLLFGGTLNAGMNEKGGFTVNARLPLREVLSA